MDIDKFCFFADFLQKGAEAKPAQTAADCSKGWESEIKNQKYQLKILSWDSSDHSNINIKCRFVCLVARDFIKFYLILDWVSK